MSDGNLRLQVVLQALDKASAPFRKVDSGSKHLTNALNSQREALRKLNAIQRDVSAFRQQQSALRDTSKAHDEAQSRVRELAMSMSACTAPTRKLSQSFEQAKAAAARLKGEHQAQAVSLQRLRSGLEKAGVSTRQLSAHERRLRGDTAKATAQIEHQRTRLKALADAQKRTKAMQADGIGNSAKGGSMAVGGMAVLRGMSLPIKHAMAFESAMADVQKVVDFQSPEAFKKMGHDIQDMSLRLPLAATEIAAIVAAAGQASIPRDELLRFTEDAAMMGVAFEMGADEAGQAMATWRTAFRLGQDEVVKLADQINYLGANGTADAQKISAVLNRVGALGEVAGMNSGSIAALGATIAGMGTQSEVTATGIKNMLLTLSSGDSATAGQRTAFEKLGLSASDMAKSMQKDAGGALVGVLEKLKELPEHEQSATLTKLFGRESVGAVAPLLTNLDLLKKNFADVADASKYSGSMADEYAKRMGTSGNSLDLLRNGFMAISSAIGETLLPDVKSLAEALVPVVKQVVAWIRANAGVVSATLKLVGSVVVAITALGGLLAIKAGAVILLVQLGNFFGWAASKLSWLGKAGRFIGTRIFPIILNVARLLLPVLGGISAPVLAIGLAVAAVALLVWKYWEPIKAFMVGVWNSIVEAAQPAMDQIKAALQPLAPLWDTISGAVGSAWNWMKQLFGSFGTASDQVEGASEAGRGFGQVIGKVLGGGINLAVGAIGLLTTAFKTILPIIMTAIGGVWTYLQGAWDLIVGLFTLDGARITEGVTKIWDGLNQILGGWPAKLMQTGIDMINGLINGALSLEAVVQEKIMGIASSIMGTFKSALGIASPSKVFAQFGEFTMQGLAGGLESSQGAPLQQITGVGDRMKQAGAGVALGIAAMPAMAAGGPVLAPGASPPGIGGAAASYTINIQAPAGADAEGIARLVRQEIEAIERQKASRFASRLTD